RNRRRIFRKDISIGIDDCQCIPERQSIAYVPQVALKPKVSIGTYRHGLIRSTTYRTCCFKWQIERGDHSCRRNSVQQPQVAPLGLAYEPEVSVRPRARDATVFAAGVFVVRKNGASR